MSDLIERQAAFEALCNATFGCADIDVCKKGDRYCAEGAKLDEVPSAQPDVPDTNFGDIISRQDAIDVAKEELDNGTFYDIPSKIEYLPTVQLERKKGKWVLQTDPNSKFYNWYRCSNCGAIIGDPTSNFCSECGFDMRGDTE